MSHRTALIALTILGLAYVFVTPPFRVPDEDTHFWRGIAIGMGHLLPNGGSKPDSAKIPQGLKTFPFVMSWVDARGRFRSGQFRAAFPIPLEQQKQPVVYFPAWYTPVPYLPQAVTVAIARLFDIRPMFAFYAARLANLFVALSIISISLRGVVVFRQIFFAYPTLP